MKIISGLIWSDIFDGDSYIYHVTKWIEASLLLFIINPELKIIVCSRLDPVSEFQNLNAK